MAENAILETQKRDTMNKRLLPFTLIAILIGSCTPASPTLPTPATTTQAIAPSETPLPTNTTISTPTPYPSLQTDGPYLLYATDWENLTILDANGMGRKQFQLPNNGFVRNLYSAVSPNGKWLAYFTGTSREEPYDLYLHLFDLENLTTFPVANLIAPGFPENLEQVKTSDPVELESCNSGPCRISIIELAFNQGIETMDWSTDSQELAFAAQIDGPSSDIYIFNVENKSTRRLTDDLENVWVIDWSPNGEKILYQNSTAGLTYTTKNLYVANPHITSAQSPKLIYGGKFWYSYGWINDKHYLVSSGGEGASPQIFRYIDVETQKSKVIWPFTAEHIVINAPNEKIILMTIPSGYLDNEPEEGTYILSIDGSYSKISNNLFVFYDGFGKDNVLGWSNDYIYSISLDGQILPIGQSEWNDYVSPLASPDSKWVLLSENQNRIALYSIPSFEQQYSWDFIDRIYSITWRPDSSGIYLSTESSIFYINISNEEITLVDDCQPKNFCRLDRKSVV